MNGLCCCYIRKTDFHQFFGGDERDRTADPLLARQVLSQLSYTPILWFSYVIFGGPRWTRTTDLTLIRRAL